MRIEKLILKNVRSHQETVLELGRFNIIRGPNGCGKSSIQMALEYLFTGRCQLTDAAGRGAEALIRSGAKELEVSAALDSGQTISRRRTVRSQVVEINGKKVPLEAAEIFLTKQFGSADLLSAVLNLDRFVEVSELEQQRFLAHLVEAGKIDIPKEIADALRAINEEPPIVASVADVEGAHNHFYDLRTETNRALKALGHMEKPDLPSDLPHMRDVRKKLEELRQQKECLIAQKAGAAVRWRNAQSRLTQVHAEIEKTAVDILSPSEEEEVLRQVSLQARADKLRQELMELATEQRIVQNALATAKELKNECPTCGQPIPAVAKAREVGRLVERLSEIDGLIRGVREELSEFGDLEGATSRLEAHRKTLDRHTKLLEERSQLQAAQKPDSADIESRMAILAGRINKGERVLEKAQQGQSAEQTWEAHVREKSILETRIDLLSKIVDFFGPTGAIMREASSRIGSFTENLNAHLAAFGYAFNFTLDPFEIRIISSPDNHSGFSLRQLSESERFRFGVAFQLAVATATGVRFTVIDRADVLDRHKRKLLTALLLSSDLEQAIVLATGEEDIPPQTPEGVKFLGLTGQKPSRQMLASSVA